MRYFALALALTGLLAACSPGGKSGTTSVVPAATSASPGASLAAGAARTYTSPFTYCRAVGTIDSPDSRYSGPNPPPVVIAGLIKAFGAPPSATSTQAFTHGTYWRCMGDAVYACNVGANLPCAAKANTGREPTAGEKKYCAANHDATFIPMYVTGHNTIYDWRCEKTEPVAGKRLSKVDKRGFLANIWYRIPAPGSAPTPATAP
ncbi:MAG: hypothetical protein ACRES9_11520 [Gammaproteobacteria bacterium]